MGLKGKPHVGVVDTAEFRTLAAVSARLISLQAQDVGAAGDSIQLAPQARHPEGMDHIGGGEMDIHRLTHRNMQFIAQRYTGIRVAHLPPPLMAGHLDHQCLPCLRRDRQHALADGDAETEQHRNTGNGQDKTATDDPAALDPLDLLLRPRLGLTSDGVEPEAQYAQEDQSGEGEHAPPQQRHGLRALACRVQGGIGAGAGGEAETAECHGGVVSKADGWSGSADKRRDVPAYRANGSLARELGYSPVVADALNSRTVPR